MADNSLLPISGGTETFANNDIAGVKYPRVKLTWGPAGTANEVDAAAGKVLPVNLRKSDGTEALFNNNGRALPGASAPVVPASQAYQLVAASTGPTVLGSTGAAGDWLDFVLIIPATTSPGAVTLTDGSTAMTIFAGGAGSVSDLRPFPVPIGAVSKTGAWKLTNVANVSSIGVGNFT